MPFARCADADIHYEIIGDDGPWVACVSRGRAPSDDFRSVANLIAARGCRALIHDRRNCGRSTFDLELSEPEEEVWADDLARLLDHVGAAPAVVLGWSRGARIALRFALRHPQSARGLVLWGLSGGPLAARYLEDYYFGKFMRAAVEGGIEALTATEHFGELIALAPDTAASLESLGTQRFITALERQRQAFMIHSDEMVLGVTDDELQSIEVQTVILPFYDNMHPEDTSAHAQHLIAHSRLMDYDPDRRTIHGAVHGKLDDEVVARVTAALARRAVRPDTSAPAPGWIRRRPS
jgi:pimeloyl-ACP methyl ester carboxylesterase